MPIGPNAIWRGLKTYLPFLADQLTTFSGRAEVTSIDAPEAAWVSKGKTGIDCSSKGATCFGRKFEQLANAGFIAPVAAAVVAEGRTGSTRRWWKFPKPWIGCR